MRSRWIPLVAALVLPGAAAAQTAFQMQIDIAQEQAAGNCLVGSNATGSGTATFDPPSNTLSWNITFGNNAPNFDNGLLDQGGELFSHFHSEAPGANGPIQVTLSNGSPKVGSTVLTAGQVTSLQAGLFYANIHSDGCTSGEIRGQVLPVPQVPLMPRWGFVLGAGALLIAVLGLRRRLRG